MEDHFLSKDLQNLQLLLKSLPGSLPLGSDHYNFASYLPLERSLDLTGDEKSAVNRDLELTFGSRHINPILSFKERGPGLEAVALVFAKYITSPDDSVLIQWATDLSKSAEAAITAAGLRIPRLTKPTEKRAAEVEEQTEKQDAKRRKVETKKARSDAKHKTEQVPPWKFEDLEDTEEKPIGPRGHPPSLFLHKFARPCRSKTTDAERFRCTRVGCKWSCKAPHQTARVGGHITYDCRYASEADKEEALCELEGQSLAVKVANAEAAEADASNAFAARFRDAGSRQRDEKANHLLLLAICDSGVAPAIVNNRRWRNFFEYMNSLVTIRHGSTVGVYIISEAAHVRTVEAQELQKEFNMTLSFDGGSSRRRQSIYTIHAITPETRAEYLLEGDEASGVSHDAKHIADTVLRVMDRVGRLNFSGCTSDDQSACKAAKDIIARTCPHIIIFVDPCHRLSNTGKDIGKLPYFKECIGKVKVVIKYFHKSNFAATHLSALRVAMDIREGLIAVGNTRFLTLYYAGTSLYDCMPAIEQLVEQFVLDLSGKDHEHIAWLQNRAEVSNFRLRLVQLTTALQPLARACKCLEASQSNISDVYVFWLSIMAYYTEMFRKNREGFPEDIIQDIRAIVNGRYAQMMSGTHGQVYLTGFFLNPEYIDSAILRRMNLNPLSMTICIPPTQPADPTPSHTTSGPPPAATTAPPPPDADLRRAIPTYAQVGSYLLQVLTADLNVAAGEKHPVKVFDVFKSFNSGTEVLDALHVQFMHYVRGDEPFTHDKKITSPMQYWKKLKNHDDTKVLAYVAIKLFSLTPNSMADERTMSNFTGLNTPDRASQKASTIVNMTQIQDHYRRQLEPPKSSDVCPVPRFYQLKEYVKKFSPPVTNTSGAAAAPPAAADSGQAATSTAQPSEKEHQGTEEQAAVAPEVDIDAELEEHEPLDPLDIPLPDRLEFEASSRDGLDLTQPALLDMLSSKPVDGAAPSAERQKVAESNEKGRKNNGRLRVDAVPVF